MASIFSRKKAGTSDGGEFTVKEHEAPDCSLDGTSFEPTLIPPVERERDGVRTAREFFDDEGERHDGPNGAPAVTYYDQSGEPEFFGHYRHGKLHDPSNGKAAYRKLHPNGDIELRRYPEGEIANGPDGEPAVERIYANGRPKQHIYFQDGDRGRNTAEGPAEESWHPNGQKSDETRMWDRMYVDGPAGEPAKQGWYENGQLRYQHFHGVDPNGPVTSLYWGDDGTEW